MKKVLQENPAIADAMNALSEFVADPFSRRYVEDTEKHRRDYEWAMQCATQEGLAEGREEGREEGHDAGFAEGREEGRTWGIAVGEMRGKAEGSKEKSREIARSLLREGLDVAFIARTTGLSVEEIEKFPE